MLPTAGSARSALTPRPTPPSTVQGIAGQGFYTMHTVPIIENTARECELTDRLRAAIEAYPQANAVLVRRHGVYVWGKSWIEAKTQASTGSSDVVPPHACPHCAMRWPAHDPERRPHVCSLNVTSICLRRL